ncbi:MAG TPA: hypothetical protein VM346_00550 [Sphingomicrobium sp.]|jgi:hypothetical protein|nr:hypothetical protein [Sphingomicrobium sp.]
MARAAPFVLIALVTACGGRSDEQALRDAANQSDPAAAAVLNEAADEGVDPQVALEKAGEAALRNELRDHQAVQARPNLPNDPNRPEPGQAVDTVPVGANVQNRQ